MTFCTADTGPLSIFLSTYLLNLERIYKKSTVAHLKVLARYSPRQTDITHEILVSRYSDYSTEIRVGNLPIKVTRYDMIYLLTAIGLSPGGSSTVHIYTQAIQRTTQNKQYIKQYKYFGRVRAVPRLCELYPGICLTTEEKARINLSQGSRRVTAGTMETHNNTIRIYRHNNKNT
jgi:hypothetical protein